jgi:hypothetical protein
VTQRAQAAAAAAQSEAHAALAARAASEGRPAIAGYVRYAMVLAEESPAEQGITIAVEEQATADTNGCARARVRAFV